MENTAFETWSVREWVRRVSQRPYLFVRDGSFRTAAAFLDGIVRGRGEAALAEFNDFANWLSERCYAMRGMPRNNPWSWYIEQMQTTDAERLRILPRLYADFEAARVAESTQTDAGRDGAFPHEAAAEALSAELAVDDVSVDDARRPLASR